MSQITVIDDIANNDKKLEEKIEQLINLIDQGFL